MSLEEMLEEIKKAGKSGMKISIKEIRYKADKNKISFPTIITRIYKLGLINVLVE